VNAIEPIDEWAVGTEAGLLACYDATFERVYRCAARLAGSRAAAEDLTQEAFVRLVRATRAGSVSVVGVGWLITTVRRLAIDRSRSDTSERARLVLVATQPPTEPDRATGDEGALLDGLSDRERAALVFRYVDGLPVGEVAALLGTSVRATESLLQRAKRRVQRNHPRGDTSA